MVSLYNCKRSGDSYRITKFDSDLNVESSYLCTPTECTCPAGHAPTCRHRKMLPRFLERNMVDQPWMYDYDRDGWVHSEAEVVFESDLVDAAQHQELPLGITEIAPGITMVELGKTSPMDLFNTIADAVGEPTHQPAKPKPWRRGF